MNALVSIRARNRYAPSRRALILFGLMAGLGLAVAACSGSSPAAPLASPTAVPSVAAEPTSTGISQAVESTPSPPPAQPTGTSRSIPPTLAPDAWKDLPVIPTVSDTARAIYQRGLQMGNDPHAFSKVGDCQNVPSMFLTIFDEPGYFRLGDQNAYLQPAIAWFSGSFSRESQAVRRGFNAASVVSPIWANPKLCAAGETPLDCELRLHHPSIAVVSLETWWRGDTQNYEMYVRQILEDTIAHGTVPIIATKADDLEGDNRINETIAKLANEYDIPLWNFWRAVQPLPGHGLLADGFHLTFDNNYFDDPVTMRSAWPWRNLTALQALDAVWRGLSTPQ